LADKLAVEGVAVDEGEGIEEKGCRFVKGEFGKAVALAKIRHVCLWGFGQIEFADAEFDGDFSGGDGAEKDDVARVGDQFPSFQGKLITTVAEPKCVAGIEENIHQVFFL
jgi:hypothetical protein